MDCRQDILWAPNRMSNFQTSNESLLYITAKLVFYHGSSSMMMLQAQFILRRNELVADKYFANEG